MSSGNGETGNTSADVNDFAAFLLDHARGASHDELSRQLADIVKAVIETGKPGQIVYTVKIAPVPKVEGMVSTTDAIKSTIPSHDRVSTLFFAGQKGELSRDHPNQTAMFDMDRA